MCGIGAVIGHEPWPEPALREALENMKTLMAGRGPDAEGLWISEDCRVGLAHRRLSTQDPQPFANQPIWSHDRRAVLVFNGEIYNHNELRAQLRDVGCAFRTRSDSEVLVNGFRIWGREVLRRIKGQFAFVAYCLERREVLAARDFPGICPLYYAPGPKGVVFGSTVQAVLAALGERPALDRPAAQDFLIMDAPCWGRTVTQGVLSLRGGFCLDFNLDSGLDQEPIPQRFVTIEPERFAPRAELSEDDWVEIVRQQLLDSSHICMAGDKEAGVYLSGGIDSVSTVGLVRAALPDTKLQTFSISFCHVETGEPVGERDFARKMADHFGTIHHEVLLRDTDLVADMGAFDLPADSLLYTCCRLLAQSAAAAGVNVALSGEGSDEIFFSYDHFIAAAAFLEPAYAGLRERFRLRSKYAMGMDPARARLEDIFRGGGVNIDLDNDRAGLLNQPDGNTGRKYIRFLLDELMTEAPDVELDKQIIYLDHCQKMPENTLRRGEGPSMDQSVELRFPFLWPDLTNLLYHMPMSVRLGNTGITKHILRKAMQGILPPVALARPKSPFGLPASRREHFKNAGLTFERPAFQLFFHKHLETLSEVLLTGAWLCEELLRPGVVEARLAAQKYPDTASFDPFLWKLWSFAAWYERVMA